MPTLQLLAGVCAPKQVLCQTSMFASVVELNFIEGGYIVPRTTIDANGIVSAFCFDAIPDHNHSLKQFPILL